MPRRAERFLTSAMSCPAGEIVDVSKTGVRLASPKKFGFKPGEMHQLALRAGSQQVRAAVRVQWVRRVSLFPARYEAGFQIVDHRPGVGAAVLQLGQFGCAGGTVHESADTSASGAKKQATPSVQASIEFEDLYALLEVEPDASAASIKSAYRGLAQRHHPDHSDAEDAAETFDRIAKAYAVLGDPRRRKWYDKMVAGELAA